MFTGRRWDFEEGSGLYYYRLRYYDPAAGRFVSRDPLGQWGDSSQLGNGQKYAGNNPVNLVDPIGLSPISTILKFIAKAGTKAAAKKAAKRFLTDKLGDLATKKGAKKLLGEVEEIVDSLDNAWWEWLLEIVELCPAIGDAMAGSRFGYKLKQMNDRLEALERRVEKYEKAVRQLQQNVIDGAAREAAMIAILLALHPSATVLTQRDLLNERGRKVKHKGKGRRLDIVLVEDGKVLGTLEVTSPRQATGKNGRPSREKSEQLARETAIRNKGGTWIKSDDGTLIDTSGGSGSELIGIDLDTFADGAFKPE